MKKERVYIRCRKYLLAGILLINLALFAPDASGGQPGAFIKLAIQAPWGKLMNFAAAWCSCKIILLSLGLFLVIECLGTFLTVSNRRHLAWPIYTLHLLPCLGFLLGGYCLLKALL